MNDPVRERSLAELHQMKRVNFYDGRRLTADDFQNEQDYGRSQRRLHNRLQLGQGVVCGLGVTPLTTPEGNGICVSAGLALDGWGREILLPADLEVVPLLLADDCNPASRRDCLLPHSLHISIRYREVADGHQPEIAPTLEPAADAGPSDMLIEGYCLLVREGAAPVVSTPQDTMALELVRAGRLHDALCLLAAARCPAVPTDPSVVLANIAVDPTGSLKIDGCGPRAIVPTNQLLAQLSHMIGRDLG